jgi:hypothetical protein
MDYMPGLALNHNPPNFTSQAARITGVSHSAHLKVFIMYT